MDELKKNIEDTLEIPVLDEQDMLTPPCVTVDCYLESPLVIGDGIPEKYVYSVTVTIWEEDKKRMLSKKEKLRQIIEADYMAPEISFGSDPDTGIYKAIFDFQIWKENENGKQQEGV